MKANELFITVFYSGKSPVAPGTVGSLVALFLGVGILQVLTDQTLFLLAILVSILGVKAINKYEEATNTHDDKSIVIDELAGMWFALAISGATWFQIIASFVFFRLLDIKKPSVIGKIDKNVKGGLGVMGDDIVAGFFAGLLSSMSYTFYLKYFV